METQRGLCLPRSRTAYAVGVSLLLVSLRKGRRKERTERKGKTAKLKAKLPCRHCMSPSHNRGIAHPGDPRLVAALAFVGVVHRITPWAELHTIFTYFRAHDCKICKMYQNVTTTSNNKIVAAHQSYHNEVPASDWQTLPIEVLHRPSPRAPPQVRADHSRSCNKRFWTTWRRNAGTSKVL